MNYTAPEEYCKTKTEVPFIRHFAMSGVFAPCATALAHPVFETLCAALTTITRAAFRERCRMMTSAFYRSRGFDQGAEGCFWVVLSAF
jgi:hypothetical protein